MQRASRKWASVKSVSALLALGLVVAACGGSDDNGAAPAPAPAPAPVEAPASLEPALDENAFYFGKEIEIIAPFAAGGGTDVQARFFAPFLEKYMVGKPRVATFNIAGAGGIIGTNQFGLQRKHENATSVLFSSGSSLFPWIFGDPALRVDYRDLVGTAAIQTGGVIYVNSNTGITNSDDFIAAVKAGSVDWVAGEQTADSLGLLKLLAYDMLGMNARAIFGYEGRGPIRVSFEQGELNINWDTTAAMVEQVAGLGAVAVPVFSVGQVVDGKLVRDPVFPDLPHFGEIYEGVFGAPATGPAIESYISLTLAGYTLQKVMWLHKDAPAEAVQELRDGFENMTNDPLFQERALEILGDYDIIVGSAVDGAVATLLDFPEERRNWLLDFMVEKLGYADRR
jgi:tripartite-type tricarboxylate transporter receptor subunit TctC